MKPIQSGLLILGAASLAGALSAQTPAPAPPPPPPPGSNAPAPPQGPMMPGMAPGQNMPRPPSAFRFTAPVGMQARFTYMGITGHKDDLGLTDAQMKSVEDLYQKAQADNLAREQRNMGLRQGVQDLAEADPVDMAKVEAAVNAYQKAQGEQMLADIRLNVALNNVLTADQRAKLKDLPPSFGMGGPGMRPPMPPRGMQGMPGMPGGPPPPPPGQPGAPPTPPPAP